MINICIISFYGYHAMVFHLFIYEHSFPHRNFLSENSMDFLKIIKIRFLSLFCGYIWFLLCPCEHVEFAFRNSRIVIKAYHDYHMIRALILLLKLSTNILQSFRWF